MTINDIKQKLGENTEKIETKAQEYWNQLSPHYSSLEPWQRGLTLIAILALLALTIYYLTKEDQDKLEQKKAKQEAMMEERLLKRMELLKKLKE